MSFRFRLYLMSTLASASLLVVLGAMVWLSTRVGAMLERVEKGSVPAAELHRELDALLIATQRALQDAGSPRDAAKLARVDELERRFLARLASGASNPVLKVDELDALRADFTAWLAAARTSTPAEAELLQRLQTHLADSATRSNARSLEAITELRASQRGSSRVLMMLAFGIAITLALVSVPMARRLSASFSKLLTSVEAVAAGDLTRDLLVDVRDDEFGKLGAAFQRMVTQLREVHLAIDAVVRQLGESAAQILAASREQEAASQTQSSSVEEVNRTMQSLLDSATHIANSAEGVSSNAERTRDTALATSKKIAELSAQANRMSEILEVIREIADRSDLLALNAALEGTRAGEAGRGFSLVANELRRLSERVGASVRDVKTLVNDIRASGASTVMVTEEARTLADNTASSARQITLVTQQQQTATEMVSTSMKDVARVLVESVASTAQTRRAAGDLAVRAEELGKLLARFKVGTPS
ncbi:MAG: methyl-accepting chemotaxis protein [Myxococcota bacterium]